jgi:hypothetical protein
MRDSPSNNKPCSGSGLFENRLERAQLYSLLKNSLLGGAALRRCDRFFLFCEGFTR